MNGISVVDGVKVDEAKAHLFYYWMYERQNIYYRRHVEKRPAPWTDDPILQTYKFTNVHRCLDRTTIWYHDHVEKLPGRRSIMFGTFVHRIFNNIPTMEMVLPYLEMTAWESEKVFHILDSVRRQGAQIWTKVHMTTGVAFAGSHDKLVNILHLLNLIHGQMPEIESRLDASTDLASLYQAVRKVNGFGPFLAYQAALDLVNAGLYPYSLDEFTVAGPGCKRGVRLVIPDSADCTPEEGVELLRRWQWDRFRQYRFQYRYLPEMGGEERGIQLSDVENSCCEFQKYNRAYEGKGRPKNKYEARPV